MLYTGNINIDNPLQGTNEINDGYVGTKQFYHRDKGIWYADFDVINTKTPYLNVENYAALKIYTLFMQDKFSFGFKNEDGKYVRFETVAGNTGIQWFIGSTGVGFAGGFTFVSKTISTGTLYVLSCEFPNGLIDQWVDLQIELDHSQEGVNRLKTAKVNGIDCINKQYLDTFYDTFSCADQQIIIGTDYGNFNGEGGKLKYVQSDTAGGSIYRMNFEDYNLTWRDATFTPVNATKEEMIKHL